MPKITDKYSKNPFKKDVISQTIKGTRAIYASPTQENTFAMVNRNTGEDNGDITFGKRITVDKTHFLKLYADGAKMFLGLKSAGVKVFMLIFDMLMTDENYQADSIILNYELLSSDVKEKISRATFYNGIKNLKQANFLASSTATNLYWINANYVFRGDRLTLVNQYVLDDRDNGGIINESGNIGGK